MPVARVRRWISAPRARAPAAMAIVMSAGATCPSATVRKAAFTPFVSRKGWWLAIVVFVVFAALLFLALHYNLLSTRT